MLPMLVVAFIGVLAALWFLISTKAEVSQVNGNEVATQLRLFAKELGVAKLQADQPITLEDGVFVRHWDFEFLRHEAADTLCARLGAPTEAWGEMRKVRASSRERCRYRLDLEGEAFDVRVVLSSAKRTSGEQRLRPTPRPKPSPTIRPELPADARGHLAILLDDAGQQTRLIPEAAALPKPVAFAVLPFLPASAETAVSLHRSGHEIWLHMPMEPEGYPSEDPGPGAILVSMSDGDLRRTLNTAINSVPFIVGMNNHMGSKATANLRLMTIVMQELRSRNLFFIDSRTTAKTRALDAARAQGVPSNRRRVFLDNDHSMAAIRLQLEDAVYEAKKYGEAIAIGHFKKTTIDVLAQDASGLKDRGVTLVRPGSLMR